MGLYIQKDIYDDTRTHCFAVNGNAWRHKRDGACGNHDVLGCHFSSYVHSPCQKSESVGKTLTDALLRSKIYTRYLESCNPFWISAKARQVLYISHIMYASMWMAACRKCDQEILWNVVYLL